MESIVDFHCAFYQELMSSKREVIQELEKKGIRILDGFIKQKDSVKLFYQKYYRQKEKPRLVLCGINPGRKGAGKTGVPFLDFKSLSALMPNVKERDQELSAQFMFRLISHFGAECFFEHVYLTNISWFGFEGKIEGRTINVNYYALLEKEQRMFTEGFIKEMNAVQPACIIPLSREVEKTLDAMKKRGEFPYPVGRRLNHPFHCAIPSNTEKSFEKYAETINEYMI